MARRRVAVLRCGASQRAMSWRLREHRCRSAATALHDRPRATPRQRHQRRELVLPAAPVAWTTTALSLARLITASPGFSRTPVRSMKSLYDLVLSRGVARRGEGRRSLGSRRVAPCPPCLSTAINSNLGRVCLRCYRDGCDNFSVEAGAAAHPLRLGPAWSISRPI